MSEASFASLGPTLLARKGGAKPAMRPQLAPLPEVVAAEQLEDLGWNDMGQDDEAEYASENPGADIVSIKPAAQPKAANEDVAENALTSGSPLMERQSHDKADNVLAEAAMESPISDDSADEEALVIKAKPAPKKKSAVSKGISSAKRAAFTLRLDTDRHLKLRLAATMQGVSAQALVTQALDAMLSEIEDLDQLATRMRRT